MVGPSGALKPPHGTGRPEGRPTNTGLDQYCTSFRQSYGKEFFQPSLGHHFRTGYSANHRPALYYSSSLDRDDNPQFGLSLLDSFESQSKRHYRRLALPDGTNSLACSGSRSRESGYLQLQTQPKARAASRQTEYKGTYNPHRLRVWVGPREESGYTEGTNLQLNTFLPQHINMDDSRRIQESVTRTDFLPRSFLQGSEALPKLAFRALRETGYTRDTQRPLTGSDGFSEDSRRKTRPALTTLSIGTKASSGFVLNAPNITSLSHAPADPQHFLTHYRSKFCDQSLVEQQRSDWMRGGVQRHRESGYSGRDTDRYNLSGYNVLIRNKSEILI
ncbi:protein phosphatase 1 regulatory subunit [Pimephales promelas]|nr:protein phosphatase 1 regulatory subunit [Pimephales promelas]KAG1929670.1 protein phosphatase 1 regulatory subunit [Pimephales promelas]KAG1929671.1 protein phosphatase 1 regulatory subunit [Pimephales promelas]KAG1929672.1 protein phosphatase 1 regulatory subunit [Pimephales promelas]KAG1929673.1 protein phosphatase 1 regulatory subunit [Pimephales promelas]